MTTWLSKESLFSGEGLVQSLVSFQMRVVFYASVLLIDKIIMATFGFNSTERLILWYLGLEK